MMASKFQHKIIQLYRKNSDFLKPNFARILPLRPYKKFDITDPFVLICQNDTEYISRQTGLI